MANLIEYKRLITASLLDVMSAAYDQRKNIKTYPVGQDWLHNMGPIGVDFERLAMKLWRKIMEFVYVPFEDRANALIGT